VTRSLLYGVRHAGVEPTAAAIGAALACAFQPRESDYLGPYLKATAGSSVIRVIAQPDPEGEPLEDGFEEFETLIYIEADHAAPTLAGLRVGDDTVRLLRDSEGAGRM
jgi:hypothetical protein